MSKKIIASIIGIAVVVVMIAAAGTYAFLSDTETSTGNQAAAWTSSLWTQTSQADFNSGVLNNVDTSSSPGNVTLPVNTPPYPASSTTGNWANGANAYLSNNTYATFNPNIVLTKSPSSNTGASWTNPNYAYASDTNSATISSGSPSGNNVWGGYGFTLTGDVITKVRVGYAVAAPQPTVALRAFGTAASGGTNGVQCTQPNGTTTNDVLIAFIADAATSGGQTPAPAGWQAQDFAVGAGGRFQIFTAVVGQNSLAGTSWTFGGTTKPAEGVIGGYSGADTTGFGGLDTTVSTRANTSGTYGTTGIATTNNNEMVIAAFAIVNDSPTWSAYSCSTIGALTEQTDQQSSKNNSVSVAGMVLPAAGPTGNSTAKPSAASGNCGILFALKSAAAQIRVDVSWDGGTTWSSKQITALTSTKTTYYYDVTSAVAWDSTKLNDTNFQVRVDTISAGAPETVSLDWLPVEVTYYNTTLWNQNYATYGISLIGDLISKLEVGFEAFAASSEKIQIQVSWNNGVNWSALQTSAALGSSDPNSTTWFDFTSAASWTPATLNNTNFQVRIWYLNNGALGQVSLDYLPVRVTYIDPSGTLASQVFDTTLSGTRWDGIVWGSTVPANTTLTFEIRASDTLFLASAATPTWTSIGTSPVLSGLPAGRYMQWRATLTTTLVTATPTLSEVRTYYYHG